MSLLLKENRNFKILKISNIKKLKIQPGNNLAAVIWLIAETTKTIYLLKILVRFLDIKDTRKVH